VFQTSQELDVRLQSDHGLVRDAWSARPPVVTRGIATYGRPGIGRRGKGARVKPTTRPSPRFKTIKGLRAHPAYNCCGGPHRGATASRLSFRCAGKLPCPTTTPSPHLEFVGNKKTSKNVRNSELIILFISTCRRIGRFQSENLVTPMTGGNPCWLPSATNQTELGVYRRLMSNRH
jgi:hypothetical protein